MGRGPTRHSRPRKSPASKKRHATHQRYSPMDSRDNMEAHELSRDLTRKLPTEALFRVASYLGEPDLMALSLVNRRMNSVAAPVLWNGLYGDPLRSKEVLLWAVDNGRQDILRLLLQRGVTPNFLYLSSLLRSRLMGVFAVQGRRGTAGPREDDTLKRELFKDHYCRTAEARRRVHFRRSAENRDAPISQDLDSLIDANFFRDLPPDKFGIVEDLTDLDTCHYWYVLPSSSFIGSNFSRPKTPSPLPACIVSPNPLEEACIKNTAQS